MLILSIIAILVLVALGGYFSRRQWLARLLKLPTARNDVTIEHDVPVPMPDGVTLLADQ